MINITVPLKPVPASRPRVTRYGVYYGKAHTQFIKDVQHLFDTGVLKAPQKPKTCPLSVSITFHIPIPKSKSQAHREQYNGTVHFQKPDIDNLTKLVLDEVLTCGYKKGELVKKRYIQDDSQIVSLHASKHWIDGKGFISIDIVDL